jgi:hypothetical protein
LISWAERARKEIEVKDKSVAVAASGGDRNAIVLEFNAQNVRQEINEGLSPSVAAHFCVGNCKTLQIDGMRALYRCAHSSLS